MQKQLIVKLCLGSMNKIKMDFIKKHERCKMKTLKYFLFVIFLSLLVCCGDLSTNSGGTVVGSTQSSNIPNLTFSVDTAYLESSKSRLVAKGYVTNNGNSKVTSPWYVEGQFYTDETYKIKIGGNYTQIGVPLSKGQSTLWTIYYSSTNFNVNDYPDCKIGDLRGIYK